MASNFFNTAAADVIRLRWEASNLPRRAQVALAQRNADALGEVLRDAHTFARAAPLIRQRYDFAMLGEVRTAARVAATRGDKKMVRRHLQTSKALEAALRTRSRAKPPRVRLPTNAPLGGFFDEIGKAVSNTVNDAVSAVKNALPKSPTTPPPPNPPQPAAPSKDYDTWCERAFPPGPDREKCKLKACAIFNPLNPGYCRANPLLNAAPWTDVGAGARGIPKHDPGFFYTVTQKVNIPELSEYEPDLLFKTLIMDPVRAVFLAGYAAVVPGVQLVMLPILAELVTAGPIGGAVAAAEIAPVAIPWALKKGGQARLEANVLTPLFDLGKDLLPAVLSALSGDPKVAAVQFAARRAARTLGTDEVSRTISAILLAIADAAPTLLDAVKRLPQSAKESGTWNTLGNLLLTTGKAAPGDPGKVVRILGTVLATFDQSIAQLAAGNPNEALNKSTVNIFGAEMKVLSKLTVDQTQQLLSEQNHQDQLRALSDGADLLANAFNSIAKVAAGVKLFGDLPKIIATIATQMRDLVTKQRNALQAMIAQGTPAQQPSPIAPSVPVLRPPLTFIRRTVPRLVAPPAPQPPPAQPPPTQKKKGATPYTAAAGLVMGAAVGGPVGAAIGAAAGLVLGVVTKPK